MNNTLINNSLKKSISYLDYRTLIKDLIKQGKSTGDIQSKDLLNYSKLNDKRMDRLDKKLKISEETEASIYNLKNDFTFLVIAEGWCGDAAQIIPVLNKIAEASSKIKLKIVLRDDNEELMNEFLTNGSKSIPKIIIVDNQNNVINSWGPRPSIATRMVLNYKEQNGSLDADFKKNLQVWYNKDKGINTQEDLIKILKAS
ncbi:MAG: thioredoxin family protein [Lutibacter sp.]|uniref:thioredoxin family protein n=1 Tax=Lutibacter sp. TaxID=1925666 RepID=UPI0017D47563|nr:thioredoxin family protein [Lutibacter sp.]MBT8316756.1 thioredoxin family protein [Lutibacter sp.]NNJ57616.1 thioredoxin family protein [Lutibacter sp.]